MFDIVLTFPFVPGRNKKSRPCIEFAGTGSFKSCGATRLGANAPTRYVLTYADFDHGDLSVAPTRRLSPVSVCPQESIRLCLFGPRSHRPRLSLPEYQSLLLSIKGLIFTCEGYYTPSALLSSKGIKYFLKTFVRKHSFIRGRSVV